MINIYYDFLDSNEDMTLFWNLLSAFDIIVFFLFHREILLRTLIDFPIISVMMVNFVIITSFRLRFIRLSTFLVTIVRVNFWIKLHFTIERMMIGRSQWIICINYFVNVRTTINHPQFRIIRIYIDASIHQKLFLNIVFWMEL